MAKLTYSCPTCKRDIKCIQSEFPLGKLINYVYNCGHMELREPLRVELVSDAEVNEVIKEVSETFDFDTYALNNWENESPFPSPAGRPTSEVFEVSENISEVITEIKEKIDVYSSLDATKRAYNFQISGIKFAEKSNFNCLIADEMGLGKTIQSLITTKKHPELLPVLVIVKGATLFQWPREIHEWATNFPFDVMTITDRSNIMPGFKYYVISMDFIGRKGVLDLLLKLNIKSVIIDECQNFKDASSLRTRSLIKLLQLGQIEHKIALSGTPIKNRAGEYFVILNILAPAHFTSYNHFCKQFLTPNEKGVYTKLNPYMEPEFNHLTSRWIIRRKQVDVQKDLPEMRINYQFCEIEDPTLKNSYNFQLQMFDNFMQNTANISSTQMLGWLAKLRAITGQAKVPNAVAFVREFMDSCEDETQKMAIGIHHHSVRDTLKYVFESDGLKPLTLSGEDSSYEKIKIVDEFNKPENRLLIVNSIAGGVGLNLQSCNNFIALERQWNGADEDQFHKRFHRDGQKRKVSGTYLIARGTIDEFFHDMVWKKRNDCASVGIGDLVDDTQSINFLREFSEFVVRHKI